MFTNNEAILKVSRVCSGLLFVSVKDVGRNKFELILRNPSLYYINLSNELFFDFIQEGLEYGLYSESEYEDFLLDNELWLPEGEEKIKSLRKDMDELKVKMFQTGFNSRELNECRKILKYVKDDINKLFSQKHRYDYLSAKGFADSEKMKFLIGNSLYDINKRKLIKNGYWEFPTFVLEQVAVVYKNSRLTEEQIRWLVRNEPWRTIWTSKKGNLSLFTVSSSELSDEQKAFIAWSSIYDAITENPDSPPQDVIDDDDLIDGWMILQRKNRDKDLLQKRAENLITNDKIKNSSDIFLPVSTKEDFEKVSSLNDAQGNLIKKQRFSYVEKHGVVKESEMPDVKKDIKIERNRMYAEKVKGG